MGVKSPVFLDIEPLFILSSPQTQITLAVNIGLFHYDTLFDYYEELSNPDASKVVRDSYNHLKDVISPELKRRNRVRFRNGHLTYPYLEHSWIPNGVST